MAKEETKVLVIDDERLIRLTIKAKLKLIGYTAVCVATIQEAVTLLNDGGYKHFKAIITDIMMGDMDGFVFRDIIRGMDTTMPIFFMTALDPEEGSGFLKRIMEDVYSFYLPKSVKAEMLVRRVQSIVNSHRVEEIIREQTQEVKTALELASHLQRSMLPPTFNITDQEVYTTLWYPQDQVSGDLFEVTPLKDGGNLYLLGDIQGHGTGAALSMMAMQSFLKQLKHTVDLSTSNPADIANHMQRFFRSNLGNYSYMTALICMHHPNEGYVEWISCGAPDLEVVDPQNPNQEGTNPEKRGGLPIGLLDGTVYTEADVVRTELSKTALCVAFTDGIFDIYRDEHKSEQLSDSLRRKLQAELLADAQEKGTIVPFPYKFLMACEASGYPVLADDVTGLVFGARQQRQGILEKSVPINASIIDKMAQELEEWCTEQGWSPDVITKIQLVFEEKLMNLHDHGIDIRDRSREQACIRLKRSGSNVEMTIWDFGTPEPSISVAAGSLDVALELKNREYSGRGRGRLMVREICNGILRNTYGHLNETTYLIAVEDNTPPRSGELNYNSTGAHK